MCLSPECSVRGLQVAHAVACRTHRPTRPQHVHAHKQPNLPSESARPHGAPGRAHARLRRHRRFPLHFLRHGIADGSLARSAPASDPARRGGRRRCRPAVFARAASIPPRTCLFGAEAQPDHRRHRLAISVGGWGGNTLRARRCGGGGTGGSGRSRQQAARWGAGKAVGEKP